MTGVVNTDVTIDPTKASAGLDKILIVGGTKGIGRSIAVEAVKTKGSKVTVVGRSCDTDLLEKVTFVKADLSLMKGAKSLAEELDTDFDLILFTTGIIAADTREESPEGIEMDMAVSYLSRLVVLKYLVPRLSQKNVRIFIMGFPGADAGEYRLDDLNSEKEYKGGFGWVHVNTVYGNEALVHDWAAKNKDQIFCGLNPGFIKTGIRSNVWKGRVMSMVGVVVETLIGFFTTSADQYATHILGYLLSEDIKTGILLNPKGLVIKPATAFSEKETLAAEIIASSEKLVQEKAGV